MLDVVLKIQAVFNLVFGPGCSGIAYVFAPVVQRVFHSVNYPCENVAALGLSLDFAFPFERLYDV